MSKEIEISKELYAMVDFIKTNVKNNLVQQCKDIPMKDLEKVCYVAEASISQAFSNSAENILRVVRKK